MTSREWFPPEAKPRDLAFKATFLRMANKEDEILDI